MSADQPVVTRRITARHEVATRMAKSADLQDLLDCLTTSAMGVLDAVDIITAQMPDGSTVLAVEEPQGTIVAWMVDDATAALIGIPGGEVDLHLTLASLGSQTALSADQTRLLTGVVAEWCAAWPGTSGYTSGLGRFSDNLLAVSDAPDETADEAPGLDPLYASVTLTNLWNMRVDLVQRLQAAGLPVDTTYDFVPHITLAYLPSDEATPQIMLNPVPLDVDNITVCVGGTRYTIAFNGDDDSAIQDDWSFPQTTAYAPDLSKAVEVGTEEMFTLAPWYVPDRLDAHGEWTDPRELQKGLWGYVESGDRDIRLQHQPEIVAGHWVEAMVWPHAVSVPVTVYAKDGVSKSVTSHTYPAGTAFLGVKWEPWAWELVKSGDLQGLSIGGSSDRLTVDLEKAKGGADGPHPVDKSISSYADPGYQSDGKPRYPTTSKEQIKSGLSNLSASSEAGKYTTGELSAIKRNLTSAARRTGLAVDNLVD